MSPIIRYAGNLPRFRWQELNADLGLLWQGDAPSPYWSEDAHLDLNLVAAETLEEAANELHAMCLDSCASLIQSGDWESLGLPADTIPIIEASWREQDFSIYGRFDLAWNGKGSPKLLEYNADTPTSLLETAVIQWQWLQGVYPRHDQLNSLHEALIEQWQAHPAQFHHFACVWESIEDRQTIAYLAETAEQAGKQVHLLDIADLGWNAQNQCFTDENEQAIESLFKLYPWEWMADEPFFIHVAPQRRIFIEPAWKMMLANKALLVRLWQDHPGHPLLLPASFSLDQLQQSGCQSWVEKPIFGREGAGVQLQHSGRLLAQGDPYDSPEPRIYQATAPLFQANGLHFVWGLWMVNDQCRALSARGDSSPITGNTSRFFPHRLV